MRAARVGLSTLFVLLLAKALVLAAFGAPGSRWTPLAFVWQDIAVALATTVLALVLRVPALIATMYAVLVGYVAVNVPIAIVLGSPLTPTMMQATGGALSDSIRYHVTIANVMRIVLVAVAGVAAPALAGRMSRRWVLGSGMAAALMVVCGPTAAAHVETAGLERNAITTLIPRGLLASPARARPGWRTSPVPNTAVEAAASRPDLSAYRGSGRGLNVILILLESTAAQYLKPYGAADDPMPVLTALTNNALVFENAYAAYPESVKGLYATLCGRMPRFGVPAEDHAALPCAPLAGAFAANGYRTALFHSGRFRYLGMDAMVRRLGFDLAEDAGAIGGHVESSFGVDEPATVTRLLSWLDEGAPGAPFFAAYLPIAGHHPYAVTRPGPFSANTELNRYRNALHEADAALGDLIAGLRRRQLEGNTVLVIAGDHGEAFGQHRGNAGHTLFIHEENVHVPYVIAIPGRTTGQTRVSTAATLLDTGATLRELAGLGPSPEDEGTSLFSSPSPMAPFFTDYSIGWLGLRDGCWKFTLEAEADRPRLYDLCLDPMERHDLAAAHVARVSAYRRWWRERLGQPE